MNFRKVTQTELAVLPEEFKQEGTEAIALADDNGTLIYLLLSRMVRLQTVFVAPDAKLRTTRCVIQSLKWIKDKSISAGYKQLIFTSHDEDVIRLMQRLGFVPSAEHVLDLDAG